MKWGDSKLALFHKVVRLEEMTHTAVTVCDPQRGLNKRGLLFYYQHYFLKDQVGWMSVHGRRKGCGIWSKTKAPACLCYLTAL